MANSSKNIVITPNINQPGQPNIVWTGNAAYAMTTVVADDNSLFWENATGQLFSIANNLTTGTIFSVNDISGIPFISVNASGNVSLVPLGGANVGVGTASPQYPLHVIGNLKISNTTTIGGIVFADGSFQNTAASGSGSGYSNVNVAEYLTGPVLIGNLSVVNSTPSTSNITGALTVAGGIGVGGNINAAGNSIWAGNVAITNTTISTSNITGALTVAGGVGVAGNITVTGQINVKTYIENSTAPSIVTNSLTIDLSTTTVFTVAMNANITTFSIINTPQTANAVSSFVLIFTYTGTAYTVVWPSSSPNIRWPNGVAPTLSSGSGKRDVFTFFTTDNGASYNAFISGQNL